MALSANAFKVRAVVTVQAKVCICYEISSHLQADQPVVKKVASGKSTVPVGGAHNLTLVHTTAGPAAAQRQLGSQPWLLVKALAGMHLSSSWFQAGWC
jgi:hypothetical protein